MSDIIVTTTPASKAAASSATPASSPGEAILGANIFKDLFAGIRDIVGGRSATYERELRIGPRHRRGGAEAGGRRAGRQRRGRRRHRLRDRGRQRQHAHGERQRHGGGGGVGRNRPRGACQSASTSQARVPAPAGADPLRLPPAISAIAGRSARSGRRARNSGIILADIHVASADQSSSPAGRGPDGCPSRRGAVAGGDRGGGGQRHPRRARRSPSMGKGETRVHHRFIVSAPVAGSDGTHRAGAGQRSRAWQDRGGAAAPGAAAAAGCARAGRGRRGRGGRAHRPGPRQCRGAARPRRPGTGHLRAETRARAVRGGTDHAAVARGAAEPRGQRRRERERRSIRDGDCRRRARSGPGPADAEPRRRHDRAGPRGPRGRSTASC